MFAFLGAFVRRFHEFKLAEELRSLDDHLLRDIGIERYQIDAVASGAMNRDDTTVARNDNAKTIFRKAA